MSRNTNIPFAVLPTSGNQAVAAAGTTLSALALNKIGVFSRQTGLAINGSSVVGPAREIFLAVGSDSLGTGAKNDIIKSAGQGIRIDKVVGYTLRCYSPGQEQLTEITGLDASCAQDYIVKFELVMPDAFKNYGFNGFTKTFAYQSDCCDTCDCTSADCKDIYVGLRDAINADEEGFLTAFLIDPADAGDPAAAELSAGELAALTGCPILRVDTVSKAIRLGCGIPDNYEGNMNFTVTTSLLDGFECGGTATVIQDTVFNEGNGKQIQFLEYEAAGWEGSPYRQTESGITLNTGQGKAVASTNYIMITISADAPSNAGFLEYESPLDTIIAIPCADSTTISGLLAILDALFAQSGMAPLADDYATCGTCGEVNTSGEDTTPGIG